MKYDIWHADMSKIIDGEAYGSVIPSCMLCVRILRIYPQASRTMNIATATSDFLEKSRFASAIFIIQYMSGTATKGKGSRIGLPFVMTVRMISPPNKGLLLRRLRLVFQS